jgi:hypothetical protein
MTVAVAVEEDEGLLQTSAPPSKSASAEPGNPQSAEAAAAAVGEAAANPQGPARATAGDWLSRLQRNMTSPAAPPVSRLEEDVRHRLRAGTSPRALLRSLNGALAV